ncbi:MAG: tetratricopeptide repeat protein [Deltaproteobacteria bacterium]|nr:tetratricopeptide repeat protein [Deltaproteobacteria bacterium]
MIKKSIKVLFFISLLCSIIFSVHPYALCQQKDLIQEGIDLYKQGNYEKAIETLTRARQEDPQSSTAAFFLGLTYKQVLEYGKAIPNLRDAVTLTPRIKEALVELIDVCMQEGKIDEAMEWIGVAERENIAPAKTAFLKGIALREKGDRPGAVESFENAKSLDPAISQAVDIQIAMTYMGQNELKMARDRFESAIETDPQSNLAGFARQYYDALEKKIYLEKPFRFAVSVFGQYDDNMVLKPTDDVFATGITNESSGVLNSSFRISYAPRLKGPWLFSGQYGISSSLHQKNVHTHDSLSNNVSITPGYNFGKYTLNLATSYSHSLVRGPSYKKYSRSLNVGPMVRLGLKDNQLLEIFAGFADNEYYRAALNPVDDRDSSGLSASLSWIWLFRKESFLNLRYQFTDLDADGPNWDVDSHRFSASVIVPLKDNVKFQAGGEVTDQEYKNTNFWFNIPREDSIYSISAGITWEFHRNTSFIIQYARIRNDSSIGIYDYERNLYTAGIEYRF